MSDLVVAYLGLGSSLGNRWSHLRSALRGLEAMKPEVRVTAVSPIYESPHLGLKPEDSERFPPHLNGVARIETTLSPEELLQRVQAVETAGKRQRIQHWGPRTIDIDILLYGDRTLHSDLLTLPHPELEKRAFVLLPLLDIAPDLILPEGRPLADLKDSPIIRAQHIEQVDAENELLL